MLYMLCNPKWSACVYCICLNLISALCLSIYIVYMFWGARKQKKRIKPQNEEAQAHVLVVGHVPSITGRSQQSGRDETRIIVCVFSDYDHTDPL